MTGSRLRARRGGRPSGCQATGASLLEILIVVAAVGVLAAIAMPRYHEYLRHGMRSEARSGLLRASLWLERAATETGRYPSQPSDLPARLRSVPSGSYAIGLLPSDGRGSGYTLSAMPLGSQAADRCGAFTLAHTGLRSLADPGTSASLVAECWNR